MASSNFLYAIGTGTAVILVGAAIVTAGSSERDPLLPHRMNTDDTPLAHFSSAGANADGLRTVSLNLRPAMDLSTLYYEGFIGDGKADGEYLTVDAHHASTSHTPPDCMRVRYEPGPTGWAGQYWLNGADNWGEAAGKDMTGYSRITFWARGEDGGERVEFKAGALNLTKQEGIRHKDSFRTSLGRMSLTREWRRYTIDLAGLDLSSVIGAFAWVATVEDNPAGLVFYIDDLQYE